MYFDLLYCTLFYFSLIENSHSDCSRHKFIDSNETLNGKVNATDPNVVVKTFEKLIDNNFVYGRIVYINNPNSTLDVLQPRNDDKGCYKNLTSRTSYTAAMAGNCEIATNAGFFNTNTKTCIGNLINQRQIYLNSGGITNANFGIKNDGKLFFGYLGSEQVINGGFRLLVSGVIWLVRNGSSVVNESIEKECDKSQETGPLSYFANVVSARTAVGATKDGTVVLVHVEGKTQNGGINLWQLAELLQSMQIVSAINLDGGGSSTLVVNDTLVSYPSDGCNIFTCERPVSTVLCVRAKFRPLSFQNDYRSVRKHLIFDSVLLVIVGILLGLIFYSLFIRWYRNRQKKLQSEKMIRLALNDNDDFIHFDLEPLLKNDTDCIE